MADDQRSPGGAPSDYRVNFFRPRPGFMRREVHVIWVMLAGWALFTFGFQLYLACCPEAIPTGRSLFGFPFHYWFTGQFLILWFILLCFLFNFFIDRLRPKKPKR